MVAIALLALTITAATWTVGWSAYVIVAVLKDLRSIARPEVHPYTLHMLVIGTIVTTVSILTYLAMGYDLSPR